MNLEGNRLATLLCVVKYRTCLRNINALSTNLKWDIEKLKYRLEGMQYSQLLQGLPDKQHRINGKNLGKYSIPDSLTSPTFCSTEARRPSFFFFST